MTRDEQGVWSATAGPLEPGLAIYTFTVDGVTTPDPINPRIKLRARTSASLVDVPGRPPELWEARDVPHGTVEVNWEKSKVTGDTRAYYVYTPPGYDQSAVHALSGFVSSPRQQRYRLRAGRTWARRTSSSTTCSPKRRPLPMIIVMPWGHAVPYAGSQSNNTCDLRTVPDRGSHPASRKEISCGARARKPRHRGTLDGRRARVADRVEPSGTFQRRGGIQFRGAAQFREPLPTVARRSGWDQQKLKQLWIGCGRQDPAFERNQNSRNF